MEKHERHSDANVYEWLDTEQRFASMAEVILDRQGRDVQLPHPYAAPKKVAYWSTHGGVLTYRLEKKALGGLGGHHYLLEQFQANKQNDPSITARFRVEITKEGTSSIDKIDSHDTPIQLDLQERKIAIKYAMSIMTTAAKDDAEKILNESIERRFPLIAASYVLSDLAIERPGPPVAIDSFAVTMKSMDFLKQMLEMEANIMQLCVDSEGDIDLDKFTHLANPPKKNNYNSFREIELRPALEQIVTEVGTSWHNTITPSHHDFI